jgi:hypothetical protein
MAPPPGRRYGRPARNQGLKLAGHEEEGSVTGGKLVGKDLPAAPFVQATGRRRLRTAGGDGGRRRHSGDEEVVHETSKAATVRTGMYGDFDDLQTDITEPLLDLLGRNECRGLVAPPVTWTGQHGEPDTQRAAMLDEREAHALPLAGVPDQALAERRRLGRPFVVRRLSERRGVDVLRRIQHVLRWFLAQKVRVHIVIQPPDLLSQFPNVRDG